MFGKMGRLMVLAVAGILVVVNNGWWVEAVSPVATNSPKIETVEQVPPAPELRRSGWNGWNTMQKVVELAIERGVAADTVVLLLLLPLIATVVSVLHYIVGLSGYGMFIPTMVAVTFLATGVTGGLLLFAMILVISLLSNFGLKKLRLHFWPARAINLLFISLGTFGLMLASTYINIADISQISIFPVLLMILLAEEFVRTQLIKSKGEAVSLTLGTLIIAMLGAGIMSVRELQIWVLRYPEAVVILGLGINVMVGSYRGMRLMEIKRFGKAIRKKKR